MIISRFPPHVGGTERQALGLARELFKNGVQVDVLTQHQGNALREENIDGVRVFRLMPGGNALWSSGLFLLNGLRLLFRKRPAPDLFHGHMIASPAVLACLSQQLFHRKAIVKIACSGSYGELTTSLKTWFGRLKLNYVLRTAQRFVCVSRETCQELLDRGIPPERAVYIPNGVDTDFFHPADSPSRKKEISRKLGLPDGRWILFAGRLNGQKQPRVLLDAFLDIRSEFPDARLLFLGEGPDETLLREVVRDKNLEGSVFIRSAADDVPDYYRMSDLFVLPSQAEGLSNSLLEAMSTGLICVATRIGGNTDVIEDGVNGFLFPSGDSGQLSAILKRALAPAFPRGEMANAARKKMVEQFAFPVIARWYMDLYKDLSNQSREQGEQR